MTTPIQWQKSSFSGATAENCIEVAIHDDDVLIRESDTPDLILTTTPAKLHAFLNGVKAGEFDHFTA
jgi:hypothetical protein